MRSLMARATTTTSDEARERVIYELEEDGTWVARPAWMRGTTARGGSIAQARKRVRALLREDRTRRRAREVDTIEEIRMPPVGIAAVLRLRRAREALDAAERAAVTTLVRQLGLGTREASRALGLTPRRVVHLAGEVADVEAEKKSERRARAGGPSRARVSR